MASCIPPQSTQHQHAERSGNHKRKFSRRFWQMSAERQSRSQNQNITMELHMPRKRGTTKHENRPTDADVESTTCVDFRERHGGHRVHRGLR